jgi:hypothetical protein
LSGVAGATTTANSSGNYTFTGLANGNYTVTPSDSAFTYTPERIRRESTLRRRPSRSRFR